MGESKSDAETAVEMGKPSTSKEQGRDSGFKTPISLSGRPASVLETHSSNPSNRQASEVLDVPHYPDFMPSGGPEGLVESPDAPCPPKGPAPDLECSICFNLYNHSRLPKLLACQHVFCAICLKLILQRRSDAWTIVCPVCRTATAVFGGLISHLPNKEDVLLGSLTCPGSQMEAPFSLVTLPEKQVPGVCFDVGQDYDNSHNRVAAKRLMFLLLFLMLAVAIVLPFLHPGLLKWALCTVVGCGLAMVGVLCYNPQWKCSTSSLSFLSCRKGPLSPDHSQT